MNSENSAIDAKRASHSHSQSPKRTVYRTRVCQTLFKETRFWCASMEDSAACASPGPSGPATCKAAAPEGGRRSPGPLALQELLIVVILPFAYGSSTRWVQVGCPVVL